MKHLLCLFLLLSFAGVSQSNPGFGGKIINTYPRNGALYVHPHTSIGFTFPSPLSQSSIQLDSIAVIGNSGKIYSGNLKLSCNRKTLIFTPSEPFILGDTVHVRIGGMHSISGDLTQSY